MQQAKRAVKKLLRTAGLGVARISTTQPAAGPNSYFNYDFETDETFKSIFREGVTASGSTHDRLVKGGAMVIDGYGFPRWPGAKKAVDEFCRERALIAPISLTTGNGALIKK